MTRHRAIPRRVAAITVLIPALLLCFVQQESEFSKLQFLQGIWKMETSKGPIFEQWARVDGNTLHGKSYRLTESDTLLLEQLQLKRKSEGIFYIPVVRNQNDGQPVAFRLISSADNRFVFENKTHDFPQRIIYTLVQYDSIVARIEGISKGKEAGSEFYFKRVGKRR